MPTAPDSVAPAAAVSLVIAITGHRDLFPEDHAFFQTEIERILVDQKKLYPSTPLLLLSGLAEGADRIAVRAARKVGVHYAAVLPMEPELYLSDFSGDESIAEFHELYAAAKTQLTVPYPHGVTSEEVSFKPEVRDRQYGCLGAFLVNVSQLMIAVWDRRRTGKVGGTAEVVAVKLGQWPGDQAAVFAGGNRSGVGPVHVLLARRQQTGPGVPIGAKSEILYPTGAAAEVFASSYKLLDRFNADIMAAAQDEMVKVQVAKSRADLLFGQETTGTSEAMEWVAGVYSWSDTLAMKYSQRSLVLWRAVFLMLGLAGVALTRLHSAAGSWTLLMVYYILLGLALATGLREYRGERRKRHEDYRALAEALRVQFFWLAAGLDDIASEKYLRKQMDEMMWIRDAMTECSLYGIRTQHPALGQSGRVARLSLAKSWVVGQAGYFQKTSLQHQKSQKRLNQLALGLACVGFAAPLIAMLVPAALREEAARWRELWHGGAEIAMLWAALAWNYAELRGFAQEARQYARMYALFHGASLDLERFVSEQTDKSFMAAERSIRDLGQEALTENGDWLSMHRERKLKAGLAVG